MKRGAILAAAALAVTSFLMTASLACAQAPAAVPAPAAPAAITHRAFAPDAPGAPVGKHMFVIDEGRGPGRMLPPGTWWRDPATVSAIGLSVDQKKKIDDIFLNARVQLIHMHASLEENELRLDEAMNGSTFDAAKAQKLIDEGADLRADLEKADAHMLLNIRGVLTADQWTKLQTVRHAERRFDHNVTVYRRQKPNGPPEPGAPSSRPGRQRPDGPETAPAPMPPPGLE